MFTVLKITDEKPKNLLTCCLKKLFNRKYGGVKIVREQLDCVNYRTIEAIKGKHGVNWAKIYQSAGTDASCLLMPDFVNPPKNSGIKRYDSSSYKRTVMCNTLVSMLKRSGRDKRKLKICLYDPMAKYTGLSLALLSLAGTVQVITHKECSYAEKTRTAVSDFGAEPVITSAAPGFARFDILYAPFGLPENPRDEKGPPTVCVDDIFNKYILTADCVTLPSSFKKGTPAGIAQCDFAAALYERANITFLGGNVATGLMQNGQMKRIKQIFS